MPHFYHIPDRLFYWVFNVARNEYDDCKAQSESMNRFQRHSDAELVAINKRCNLFAQQVRNFAYARRESGFAGERLMLSDNKPRMFEEFDGDYKQYYALYLESISLYRTHIYADTAQSKLLADSHHNPSERRKHAQKIQDLNYLLYSLDRPWSARLTAIVTPEMEERIALEEAEILQKLKERENHARQTSDTQQPYPW